MRSGLWDPKKVMIGAFLLCFIIAGTSFWQIPYSNVTMPNSFFGIGVIVVFAVAAALAFQFSFIKGLLVPGLVFPAVLMVRVIVEGVMEPSRHNLWPLALIIAVILGLVVAGTGATLGWLASRLFR
jgi:hypothetical protein